MPRLGELQRLVEALEPGAGGGAVTALRGMGGVGKTTLAIAACHDATVLERFPDGVLWATLGPSADKPTAESKVADAQQAWAEALGDDLSQIGSLEARAARLRARLHGKTCLLVVDDVWDDEVLEHLLVGGGGCFTLLTTRERHVAQSVGGERMLGVLEPEEASALLSEWVGDVQAGSAEEAAQLAARLGYLPLALRLAGAQAMDGVRWADLLEGLSEAAVDLLGILDMDAPTRQKSLELAFDLSLERLSAGDRERFVLLGVFAAGRAAPFEADAAAAVGRSTC